MRESFLKLIAYCKKEQYMGWDPYDGLNSKVFQYTPLKKLGFVRLLWIQLFKRNPINFRPLLLIPKQHNAKGIALFLNAYCNLYKLQEEILLDLDLSKKECLSEIDKLTELLISLKSVEYSNSSWGYNFAWQARLLFLFPKGTPTVVATSYAAHALSNVYEITKNKLILKEIISCGDFILNNLNRTKKKRGFLFSYSPLNGNNTVYNASLLGSKTLSFCYKYTREEKYKTAAQQSVFACIDKQNEDGSWFYGELDVQNWIDSFHTGYNLDALAYYSINCNDDTVKDVISKGLDYYVNNFFLDDGTPKYYHDNIYPIDIHSPAQLFVTLSTLEKYEEYKDLCNKVMIWTLDNMQDEEGYFYYQKKKYFTSKIPYMRWSQAFMMNAMSYYLLNNNKGLES